MSTADTAPLGNVTSSKKLAKIQARAAKLEERDRERKRSVKFNYPELRRWWRWRRWRARRRSWRYVAHSTQFSVQQNARRFPDQFLDVADVAVMHLSGSIRVDCVRGWTAFDAWSATRLLRRHWLEIRPCAAVAVLFCFFFVHCDSRGFSSAASRWRTRPCKICSSISVGGRSSLYAYVDGGNVRVCAHQ